MSIKQNQGRGDGFIDRLFSYLRTVFSEKVHGIKPIRAHVYMLKLGDKIYIIKGYRSAERLKLQEDFTDSIRAAGFLNSYLYRRIPFKPLFFEGLYYGILEYIYPHPNRPFSFMTSKERKEGLQLLLSYHSAAQKCVPLFENKLPHMDLYEKWEQRSSKFLQNESTLQRYLGKRKWKEIIGWSEEALDGLLRFESNFQDKERTILHCDLAYHNFLRGENGELYLIDFDLISIGPADYDYLQYAGRILPHTNWSLAGLFRTGKLKDSLSNPAFLYGLLFPSDIMREWNRLLESGVQLTSSRVGRILELTEGQFEKRRRFVSTIRSLLY
ncbi:phosphotransferase [Bacillus massilinigeriensis]|uniref:phosphotransferase n=1 Tax=Bacillus mediterraneensis TaxID=1805474 RepID=UPI0008F7F368|nr:phosphotransferase [Bacillus mediterraneensis]